jgi:large subunit ribosomal protein L25
MATAQLSASARSTAGKGAARSLRSSGQIPGIIYGHAREPQSLALNTRDLEKVLSRISYENTVVELNVEGKTTRTLIREIQRHPFKKQILHIDFQELVAGEVITVSIPLVLVGTPEGVRLGGGILDQVLRDIEIEVDPANIPNHIDVDVSALTIGHSIHVRDLPIPAGAKVMTDEDLTVCVVAVPRAAIETPAAGVEAITDATAEPELIKKGKEDEEDEEAPAKK